jgi:hypothetical protein
MDMGFASLCHVLVDSLGVRHDSGTSATVPYFQVSLELERLEGLGNYGVLWGFVALSNPSMLAFLPPSGLWIWYRWYQRGLRSFTGVVLAAAVFFACLTPWLARNYRTFGGFVFIRDDFGLQFRLGNGPCRRQADGLSSAQPECSGV